eukprot:1337280-Pyramimonas_sp.AAC.3
MLQVRHGGALIMVQLYFSAEELLWSSSTSPLQRSSPYGSEESCRGRADLGVLSLYSPALPHDPTYGRDWRARALLRCSLVRATRMRTWPCDNFFVDANVSVDDARYNATDPRLIPHKWEEAIVSVIKDPKMNDSPLRPHYGPLWLSYLPRWALRPLVRSGGRRHIAKVRLYRY